MKHTSSQLKLLAIVLVIGLGTTLVFADSVWFEPTAGAPSNNITAPVNVGRVDQIKTEGLSVNGFSAAQNALYNGKVFVAGSVHGGVPGESVSTVKIGQDTTKVGALANGGLTANGYIRADDLQRSRVIRVCANQDGRLIECGF